MSRCILHVKRNGEKLLVTQRRKGGKFCKFRPSTKARHIKKHGCSGRKCEPHVRHAEKVIKRRNKRFAAMRLSKSKSIVMARRGRMSAVV